MKKYIWVLLGCLWVGYASAIIIAEIKPGAIKATTVIKNLPAVLAAAKQQADIPVLFPTYATGLCRAKQCYAWLDKDITPDVAYAVAIDDSKNCHGAKYCNQITFYAIVGGNPTIYHDRNNKPLTHAGSAPMGVTTYFTPGHAMADYWPGRVEMRIGRILYVITWGKSEPEASELAQEFLLAITNDIFQSQQQEIAALIKTPALP